MIRGGNAGWKVGGEMGRGCEIGRCEGMIGGGNVGWEAGGEMQLNGMRMREEEVVST